MGNAANSDSRVSGAIRKCGIDDAAMLHQLSVETYVDTFDGTSSDEDMQKFLEETYSEPILREELANPNSVYFVISMPAGARNGVRQRNKQNGGEAAGFADSDNADDSNNSDSSAVSAGIPAGYIKLNFGDAQIEDMGPDAMEVQRLYIQKAFKGCGLGTQLMNKAFDLARERKLKKVWLGVWEHNEPAKRFYASKGFVRVGQHAFWQGDDKQTDYLMARDL
ncbi:GNAT family N-acetyltransferase [Bifidobacterium sp. ESL0690]|uniref:GNAT family N-acetyltransferase n=1 Tax=Bifidobacterium sp. ESL0690 TaxID=2983214 RepID=UPI0023F758CF|nr:GNAT family N-acetyltransferase [Bifidobacterium sp. ESL0690]WEV46462.1 GNAT family N-acetyltransferase [Bifidobacterium sp. ESL0690]